MIAPTISKKILLFESYLFFPFSKRCTNASARKGFFCKAVEILYCEGSQICLHQFIIFISFQTLTKFVKDVKR